METPFGCRETHSTGYQPHFLPHSQFSRTTRSGSAQMQSPGSSMGSSAHDLMMAALAIANGGGASIAVACVMGLRTGYIPATEEYKALQQWASQHRDEVAREQSIAKTQMGHLIGNHNESRHDANKFRRETITLENELNLARVLLQSERSTSQQILQGYGSSCHSLELSRAQLAHLAQKKQTKPPWPASTRTKN